MMYHALVLLLLAVVGETSAVKAGFQTRITQRALDYACTNAIDALATRVSTLSIPDQSGHDGHLDYSLHNIKIRKFDKPSSRIQLVPNTGLTWTASNANINLHSDWHVRYKKGWVKVSTSGSVDVDLSGISFSVTLVFGTDSTGRVSVKSGGCNCQISGASVHIHGSLIAKVLNLLRGQIERRVKDLIRAKLCDVLNDQINNNAEKQLQKVKVTTPLMGKRFMLDYSLVAPPSFDTAYMQTFHKGEITWTVDKKCPPFSPSPLPPSPSSSNMLYLWVGDYVPQSFAYAAQNHGFLQYNLTTKDLSPNQMSFLNTTCDVWTCVGNMVPIVATKYPGMTVELRMNSTSVPQVTMAPNLLQSRFTGNIAVYVNTPVQPPPYLLTLNVSAVFNMTATVSNQLVVGNISDSRFKVSVLDSAVGPVKSKVINTMVGFAMKFFIIPKMNEQGNRGFPLPITDQIKFTNTQLHIQQNAVMIGTDLSYNFNFN